MESVRVYRYVVIEIVNDSIVETYLLEDLNEFDLGDLECRKPSREERNEDLLLTLICSDGNRIVKFYRVEIPEMLKLSDLVLISTSRTVFDEHAKVKEAIKTVEASFLEVLDPNFAVVINDGSSNIVKPPWDKPTGLSIFVTDGEEDLQILLSTWIPEIVLVVDYFRPARDLRHFAVPRNLLLDLPIARIDRDSPSEVTIRIDLPDDLEVFNVPLTTRRYDVVKVMKVGDSKVVPTKTIAQGRYVKRYIVAPTKLECFETLD